MNKCYICFGEISKERREGLQVLGTNPRVWTCLGCAPINFKKGIFLGTSGVAPMVVCDDLGDSRIVRENTDYPQDN